MTIIFFVLYWLTRRLIEALWGIMAVSGDLQQIYLDLDAIYRDLGQVTPPATQPNNFSVMDAQQKLQDVISKITNPLIVKKDVRQRIVQVAKRIDALAPLPVEPSVGLKKATTKVVVGALLSIVNKILPEASLYDDDISKIREQLRTAGISKEAFDGIDFLVEQRQEELAKELSGLIDPTQIKVFLTANVLRLFCVLVQAADQRYEDNPFFLLESMGVILKNVAEDMKSPEGVKQPVPRLEEMSGLFSEKIMLLAFPQGAKSILIPPSMAAKLLQSDMVFSKLKTVLEKKVFPMILGNIDTALERIEAGEEPKKAAVSSKNSPIGPVIFTALKRVRKKDRANLYSLLNTNKELTGGITKAVVDILLQWLPELEPLRKILPKVVGAYIYKYGCLLAIRPSVALNAVLAEIARPVSMQDKPLMVSERKQEETSDIFRLDLVLRDVFRRRGDRYRLLLASYSFAKKASFIAKVKKLMVYLQWICIYQFLSYLIPWLIKRQYPSIEKIPSSQERTKQMTHAVKRHARRYGKDIAELIVKKILPSS